jgi:DNA-binding CsgD family transcriptional regulator
MLMADDSRRYRDVNDAACRLMKSSRERLLSRRIDDFTPPELRPSLNELWRAFLDEGSQAGRYRLALPDGTRVEVEYSAMANVVPGRHLSIFIAPLPDPDTQEPEVAEGAAGLERRALTAREREVLAHVALGLRTPEIADRLSISAETARTHAKNAMEKLGARSRAHAVALALRDDEIAL